MGLTIHYTIEFQGTQKALQAQLEQVRQKCLDMPFKTVGEVAVQKITAEAWQEFEELQKKYKYPNNSIENLFLRDKIIKEKYEIDTWDIIEGQGYYKGKKLINCFGKPTVKVGLYLLPDEGCEISSLNFYKRGNKYFCQSSCKTQYAEHFVRSHILVINVLTILQNMGFKVDVYDAGKYWETRDLNVLAKNINSYTNLIKSVLGTMGTSIDGLVIVAPITKCQNYMKVDNKKPSKG